MISLRPFSNKLAAIHRKSWIWVGLAAAAAVPAIRLYYIQELIAALMLFSVLFVGVATVVLIIFLLDRASQHVVTWVEAGVARLVHRARGARHAHI